MSPRSAGSPAQAPIARCPFCGKLNRLAAGPTNNVATCGNCKKPLFPPEPVKGTDANWAQEVTASMSLVVAIANHVGEPPELRDVLGVTPLVDEPHEEEEPARGEAVIDHLQHAALEAEGREAVLTEGRSRR